MNDITLILNWMSASDVRFLLVLNSLRTRLQKYVWSVSFNSWPYFSNFRYNCKTSRDVDALMVNNVPNSLKSRSIVYWQFNMKANPWIGHTLNLYTRWRNGHGACSEIIWNIGNAVNIYRMKIQTIRLNCFVNEIIDDLCIPSEYNEYICNFTFCTYIDHLLTVCE